MSTDTPDLESQPRLEQFRRLLAGGPGARTALLQMHLAALEQGDLERRNRRAARLQWDEVTAAPPCAKPRTHQRTSNGAPRRQQQQTQQDDDFDPENY